MSPFAPKRPCVYPMCPNLVDKGYCQAHQDVPRQMERERSRRRREDGKKNPYNDRRWRSSSKNFLMRNPLCIDCSAENRVVPAAVTDHEIPHRGDMTLFWDQSNWRPRCAKHHNAKTAKQDGGFGNPCK
jgi:5-methylcytosine-specific restriction enzyme A